jgi:poly-gamma-glutamate capsule biosynthesis protein CapA/YwtB (metallophosphatase superfamily)
MNRPGIPPIVVTWPDRAYLAQFTEDIAALRQQTDIVVASCHWGLGEEVLDYMTAIAHAAIDSGADIVIGHGPHYSLPVEIYRGRPIFYGLGSFSFHTGHGGRRHGDWIGMMARVELEGGRVADAGFRFVRHNDANETVLCSVAEENETLTRLTDRASRTGTRLEPVGDTIKILR